MYWSTLIQIYAAEFWVHTGNITTTADKRRYTSVHDIYCNLDDTHCDIFSWSTLPYRLWYSICDVWIGGKLLWECLQSLQTNLKLKLPQFLPPNFFLNMSNERYLWQATVRKHAHIGSPIDFEWRQDSEILVPTSICITRSICITFD